MVAAEGSSENRFLDKDCWDQTAADAVDVDNQWQDNEASTDNLSGNCVEQQQPR